MLVAEIAESYVQNLYQLPRAAILADLLYVNKIPCPYVRMFTAVAAHVQLPKYRQCCSAIKFVINGSACI